MKVTITAMLALAIACGASVGAVAATAKSNACKECSDHQKRCMRNYPGPTCKIDYDICVKACRSKT